MLAYDIPEISSEISFLEVLDRLNEKLSEKGQDPIAFDHDCREGVCGKCSLVINGSPHGNQKATTTCQLKMSSFSDGEEIYVEPWRANAFPILKDLSVDRSALERVVEAGGYDAYNTSAKYAHEDSSSDSFTDICNGCGACVAVCNNTSAMLFVSAKVAQLPKHLNSKYGREQMTLNMVNEMDANGFGDCTSNGACTEACPKEISLENIARVNREYLRAKVIGRQ